MGFSWGKIGHRLHPRSGHGSVGTSARPQPPRQEALAGRKRGPEGSSTRKGLAKARVYALLRKPRRRRSAPNPRGAQSLSWARARHGLKRVRVSTQAAGSKAPRGPPSCGAAAERGWAGRVHAPSPRGGEEPAPALCECSEARFGEEARLARASGHLTSLQQQQQKPLLSSSARQLQARRQASAAMGGPEEAGQAGTRKWRQGGGSPTSSPPATLQEGEGPGWRRLQSCARFPGSKSHWTQRDFLLGARAWDCAPTRVVFYWRVSRAACIGGLLPGALCLHRTAAFGEQRDLGFGGRTFRLLLVPRSQKPARVGVEKKRSFVKQRTLCAGNAASLVNPWNFLPQGVVSNRGFDNATEGETETFVRGTGLPFHTSAWHQRSLYHDEQGINYPFCVC